MSVCGLDLAQTAEDFRVMPSYRDGLKFSASMIDPNAMDSELTNWSYSSAVLPTSTPPILHHKWGWWSLVAPFIL